jgi:hypothetical protein
VTVAVEFLGVVIEIDAEEDVDDREDVFEVMVVTFADVEAPDVFDVFDARIVNGSVVTCAKPPNWKIFGLVQQVVLGFVSQQ